jgi:hypothetical protein
LAGLNTFLDAPLPAEQLNTLLRDPVFSSYSKASDYPFSTDERRARLQEAHAGHAAEINKGMHWLRNFSARETMVGQALEWFGYHL